jgi:anti-sigma regulatory factor (Ser/Thr protein kinase)
VISSSDPAGFRARQAGHLNPAVPIASRRDVRAGGQEVSTSSVVHLPCAPASVALARRALADELRAAGVFDYAVADAALVMSELLSNAILHAYPLPGERLQVAWIMEGSSVQVAVSDGGSATVPHAGHPSPASIAGRGLSIVEHLCQTWGVRADGVGLTVWAVLAAPRHNGSVRHDAPPGPLGQAANGDSGSPRRRAGVVGGLRTTSQ